VSNSLEKQLEKLVESFDATYSFSDDHTTYMRGKKQENEIRALAMLLPYEVARGIYNRGILKKFSKPEFAEDFLWQPRTSGSTSQSAS
jgi:hypothetical protein